MKSILNKKNAAHLNQLYDISVTLGKESIDYPGDPPFRRELFCSIDKGGLCNISKLTLSAHAGTHIDAPSHFIQNHPKSIDQYPVQNFILPAQVVSIASPEAIGKDELEKINLKAGSAVLFKTGNSLSGLSKTGTFSENYVYLSPEAADYCVEKKVKLVGIDYITIEKYGDQTFPSHHILLGNNIFILEGLNLESVPPGHYTLICLPLKIFGGEASPVRAVLL